MDAGCGATETQPLFATVATEITTTIPVATELVTLYIIGGCRLRCDRKKENRNVISGSITMISFD